MNGTWIFPETKECFDPKDMIQTITISCDTGETIQNMITEYMNKSVRTRSLPWWEIVILHNTTTRKCTEKGGGESLVLFRIDHALGDGMAVGRLFESFLTDLNGEPVKHMIPVSMMEQKRMLWKNKIMMAWRFLSSLIAVTMGILGRYDHDVFFFKRQRNEKGVVS